MKINKCQNKTRGLKDEKTENPEKPNRTMDVPLARGKKEKVSGKHTRAGKRVHGVRGRARKPERAERVSEESEKYSPTRRNTRFIESSLGIKSCSELAPYLAKGVERVMASLLKKSQHELSDNEIDNLRLRTDPDSQIEDFITKGIGIK